MHELIVNSHELTTSRVSLVTLWFDTSLMVQAFQEALVPAILNSKTYKKSSFHIHVRVTAV